jgi:hypothetical protein
MTRLHVCAAAVGCVILGVLAPAALANPAPPPEVFREREERRPPPEGAEPAVPPMIDPVTGQPRPMRPEPRRRNGPFRSCGSGMGVGLAGIGVAWGLMWVGTRYAGRITRRDDRSRT